MIYDNDKYNDEEEDNELWDDELEIISDDFSSNTPHPDDMLSDMDSSYNAYIPDDADHQQDNTDDTETDEGHEAYYSEPEPKAPAKSRRERFFGKNVEDEEDDGNDFFDSDAEPAPAPEKKPKAPKLDPEDPDYWIEEESPLSGIIHKPRNKWKWWLGASLALLTAMICAWIWFFTPYVDSAVKYGYIKNMERRGSILKTFEGTMIPYKELGDPNPMHFETVHFSVESDSVAAQMKRMMLDCIPVRVEYEVYHRALPWKGEERMIIIRADSADPRKILPPEYRGRENYQ